MASDKLPAPFTGDSEQYLRGDDSFATYLAHVRESFSNANSRSSSFQSLPNNNHLLNNNHLPNSTTSSSSSNKVELQSELDVFGAEKYFSGILDRQQQQHHHHDDKRNNNIKGVSTCSSEEEESTTNSCTGILGVKYVSSSSSCSGRQRSFFSVFRCYCTPKSAVKEEAEEDARCRIDAKTTALDFRKSLDVTRVERCRPLHKDASSDLFEISNVHSMK